MDKNILIKKIKNVGFTEKEAKVYIAALENGTSVSSEIADSAEMNRITTYGILRKLGKKGAVTSTNIKGVKHFTAIEPEILIDDIQKKASDLSSSLPLFKSIQKSKGTHPVVRFFEGIEGVKKAYKETLYSKTKIYNYANSKNIREHWLNYDEEYVRKRMENKIFLKGLAPDDREGRIVQKEDSEFYRETKLLDKKHFQVENEINIFDSKVLIASYEPEPFAIMIESQAVADTQRQIFEMMWNIVRE